MPETTETEETTTEAVEIDAGETQEAEGEENLGDAGAKALAAIKKELRDAKTELADRRAAAGDKRGLDRLAQERKELEGLREFKAKAEGTEAEYKASLDVQRVQQDALTAANGRIIKSELRASAKGKLADPSDAHLYIDLTNFDVNDDGEVDSAALDDAIDELLTRKPHLAVVDPRKFAGSADQGAKSAGDRLTQLNDADIENMSPADVNKARREGRLNTLLGIS